MMWTAILKSEVSLGLRELQTMLFMESTVDSLVNDIEEKGITKGTKELFRKIREGEESIEELHSVYSEIYDLSLEDYKKNFQKLLDASPPLQFSDVEPMLDTAILLGFDIQDPSKETTEADEDNFQELSKKVKELSNVSDDTMLRNPVIRRKLRVFRELDKRWLLTFKKIPSDSTEKAEFDSNLEEFSKLLFKNFKVTDSFIEIKDKRVQMVQDFTSDVKEGKKFKPKKTEPVTRYKRIRIGRPSGDDLLTYVASSQEFNSVLKTRQKIKAFFAEKMIKYEPNLEGAEQYSEVIGQLDSADVLAAKGITFTAKQNLNGADIDNYLTAIRKIPKTIENFVPDYVGSRKLPKNTFLTRESLINTKTGKVSARKALNLNPYAKVIIDNTYRSTETEDWFQDLFGTVRETKVVPSSTLKIMLYDDIVSAIRDKKSIVRNAVNYSPKFNFNVQPLIDLELSSNPETARDQIKTEIGSQRDLSTGIDETLKSMKLNMLSDKSLFTYAESKKIKEIWANAEEDLGDLDITLVDSDNNTLTEEEEKALAATGGISRSLFARIEIEDMEYDRKSLVTFLESAEQGIDFLRVGQSMSQIYDIATGVSEKPFVSYLLSVPSEELNDIINSPQIGTTNAAEKLDPIRSLAFLSKVGSAIEGSNQGLVKEALKKLVAEEDETKKEEIATKLNEGMVGFIADVKKLLISGFQTVLDDFAENWATKTWGKRRGRVMDAINQFKDTNPPLLTGGDA